MFIVSSYPLAILFCFITMLCWGSWANTLKLANAGWRFELFYWDYVIGIVVFSILAAFTLGSVGTAGRGFILDLSQADAANLWRAFIGGIIFNAANILFSAAIAIAGMAVAFPVGIGLALILGVLINYFAAEKGSIPLILTGILLITIAIIINAFAYRRANRSSGKVSSKGLLLSLAAGLLMSFFYRFIASAMDLNNFEHPAVGKMTPYTAVVIFALGILASNFLFNTILMKKPIQGHPTGYKQYFSGKLATHLVGILGGVIWATGNLLNLIAAGKAGPAISYGLGQGATMVAAFWGVFIWKEFRNAPRGTANYLAVMFLFFITGIAVLVFAGS